MIQPAFSAMITLMLAKFILNDVPHALGLDNPTAHKGLPAPEHIKFTAPPGSLAHPLAYYRKLYTGALRILPLEDYSKLTFIVIPDWQEPDSYSEGVVRLAPAFYEARNVPAARERMVDGLYHEVGHSIAEKQGIVGPDERHSFADKYAGKHMDPWFERFGGPNYGRLSTPGQLSYIAVLCQQLKITTPYEERVKTFGEAGVLIRELEAEREHRKKLKSGNPNPRNPKFPIKWDIRAEKPGVDSPKWESYKKLIEELRRFRAVGVGFYATFDLPFFRVEDIPTKELVDEIASVIRSHNIEVLEVIPYEEVPEAEE